MERGRAFLFSFGITLIFAFSYISLYSSEGDFERVIVTRVLDGDTIELEDGRKVRLANINTPESWRPGGDESSDYLKRLENRTVELDNLGIDNYGRTIGRIYYDEYVNLEIVRLGLAHVYIVEENELSDFISAENEARTKGLGIWSQSRYYGCIETLIDKDEEFIVIYNECGVNLRGWIIKDESTKDYEFGDISRREIILYSGDGENEGNKLYWKRGNVWNNDKDSVFIRDPEGLLVYYDSYGY